MLLFLTFIIDNQNTETVIHVQRVLYLGNMIKYRIGISWIWLNGRL